MIVEPKELSSVSVYPEGATAKPPARRGRPPKALIEARKKPGKVGRPAGDAARIAEFKARLLSTSGDKVIQRVLDIALNDDHPGQMAAIKMCLDRMLPVSMFEKDVKKGSNAITINITGVGNTEIQPVEYLDMETTEDE
jgi:hypothetical protein